MPITAQLQKSRTKSGRWTRRATSEEDLRSALFAGIQTLVATTVEVASVFLHEREWYRVAHVGFRDDLDLSRTHVDLLDRTVLTCDEVSVSIDLAAAGDSDDTGIIIPLRAGSRCVGALFVAVRDGLTQTDIRVARAVAIQLAVMLDLDASLRANEERCRGIAHDFNNLLSVVLAQCDYMSEKLPEKDPVRDDLEEIREAAVRGASLARQLRGLT
jgi:hypothetical protein